MLEKRHCHRSKRTPFGDSSPHSALVGLKIFVSKSSTSVAHQGCTSGSQKPVNSVFPYTISMKKIRLKELISQKTDSIYWQTNRRSTMPSVLYIIKEWMQTLCEGHSNWTTSFWENYYFRLLQISLNLLIDHVIFRYYTVKTDSIYWQTSGQISLSFIYSAHLINTHIYCKRHFSVPVSLSVKWVRFRYVETEKRCR